MQNKIKELAKKNALQLRNDNNLCSVKSITLLLNCFALGSLIHLLDQ